MVLELPVILWLAAATVAPDGAAPPDPAAAASRARVTLVMGPADPELQSRILGVLAHLVRAGAEVRIESRAFDGADRRGLKRASVEILDAHDAAAVYWIDLAEPGLVRLVLASRGDPALRGRTLPFDREAPAAGIEVLANVVAGAAWSAPLPVLPLERDRVEPPGEDAAAAGQAVDVSARESVPAMPGAPPRTWPRIVVGAAYEGVTFADQMPWHSAVALRLGGHLPRGHGSRSATSCTPPTTSGAVATVSSCAATR